MGTIAATELTHGLVSYRNLSGATARVVHVATGEVAVSVVCGTAKWKDPTILGEAIATAIKIELGI